MSPNPHPVAVRALLDQPLSRWLWLVKWLLLIPHYVVLLFLGIAFVVVSVIAFFAILFTRTYPQSLFDFNVGVMRWGWRVSYYGYSALGTDRYPPFTLAEVPDYPARLEIEYPGELNRWLPLVKWLLAIPHLLVVAVFAGSSWANANANPNPNRDANRYANGDATNRVMIDTDYWSYSSPSLLGLLVLFAAVALLFTTRYPRGLYDFAIGINRWIFRVAAYVALMTDRYPPFRLDQGGEEPADGPGYQPAPSGVTT
jgi:hypothetical protein